MNISFRHANFDSEADCRLLARWENDPEIKFLSHYHPDSMSASRLVTAEEIAKRPRNPDVHRFMILRNNEPIGECSFEIDGPQVLTRIPHTAWVSITIGESQARGQGIGRIAMEFLENEAKKMGAKRVELGVFEFNTTALKFYLGLGYQEFKRIPHFTYFDGKMWDDVRMLKNL